MIVGVLGGTFENIHVGHIKLLMTAFLLSDKVIIGVTSDDMATKMRRRRVKNFEKRVKELKNIIESISNSKEYVITKIDDPYGPADKLDEINLIVVSTETFSMARKINRSRIKKGMRPLLIVVIELIETDSGYKVSSSLIHHKKVDEWGRQAT